MGIRGVGFRGWALAPSILAAVFAIVVGIALLFYGYPIFRVLLPIFGLVIGYYIGRSLLPGQPIPAVVIGIVIGLVLALLAYSFWSVLVAIAGILIGFSVGYSLGLTLALGQAGGVIAGVVGAVIFGLLYFSFRDLMVIISTATSGATSILYGVGALVPAFAFLEARNQNLTALIVWIVLAAVGIAFQYARFGKRRIYTRRVAVA